MFVKNEFQQRTWLRLHTDGPHQEKGQMGRRKDLQPQERQDLQVFHLARRQQPEGPRLPRHVL